MTLADLVEAFVTERQASGLFLDSDRVLGAAVAATRFYMGWAPLDSTATLTIASVTGTTDLSDGEWSIIAPLFRLYVERETAVVVEASRAVGLDAVGRSSSEIEGEIQQRETEMPQLAFVQVPFSIGIQVVT